MYDDFNLLYNARYCMTDISETKYDEAILKNIDLE
jgi:hypothetical protein